MLHDNSEVIGHHFGCSSNPNPSENVNYALRQIIFHDFANQASRSRIWKFLDKLVTIPAVSGT